MYECMRRLMILVLILVLALSTMSCGKTSPQKKPAKSTAEQKPPTELQKMKKDLAELGMMLEKRRMAETESGQGSKEAEEKGGGKTSEKEKPTSQWKEEMDVVRSLHQDWNGLEPEAASKGLRAATQAGLEESLTTLTQAVENRQALESELAANQVFRYYIDASALFKTGVPPDLDRIRYHVTESRLQGTTGNWMQAEEQARRALEIWQRLSYSLDKIERNLLYQVEHSLTDLVGVVKEQDNTLTTIKTEIALQNIDKLERQIKASP